MLPTPECSFQIVLSALLCQLQGARGDGLDDWNGSAKGDAIASGGFAPVEQAVNPFDGGLLGIAGFDDGGSGGDRDANLLACRVGGRFGDQNAAAIGEGFQPDGGDIVDDHEKLFAAPASEGVSGAQMVGDGFADGAQGVVAGIVAEVIVHQFEVIDVKHQDSDGAAEELDLLNRLFDLQLRITAIGHSG